MREDPIPRFIRIPGGEFTMGSDDGADDERPTHQVQVDAFHVSVHPTTVEQYAAFTRDTAHVVPAVRDLPMVVTPAHESAFRELAAPHVWRGSEPPRERGKHPVTLVTHADATAYCRWLSGRLAGWFACRPKPNGNAPRAVNSPTLATRGATTWMLRARISCPTRR